MSFIILFALYIYQITSLEIRYKFAKIIARLWVVFLRSQFKGDFQGQLFVIMSILLIGILPYLA